MAINAASALNRYFIADIDAALRVAPWDVGADEYGASTAVTLLSFDAQPSDGAVDLVWRTGSEVDNLGFHLYRSLSENGPWTRLTSSLVPGRASRRRGRATDGGIAVSPTARGTSTGSRTSTRSRSRHSTARCPRSPGPPPRRHLLHPPEAAAPAAEARAPGQAAPRRPPAPPGLSPSSAPRPPTPASPTATPRPRPSASSPAPLAPPSSSSRPAASSPPATPPDASAPSFPPSTRSPTRWRRRFP